MKKRAEIFHRAELILIAEDAPIVPLYFYAGFNYYHPEKIGGVWPNLLDEHPLQYIYKKSRGSRVEGRGPDASARESSLVSQGVGHHRQHN
jgi:hypothetical protein